MRNILIVFSLVSLPVLGDIPSALDSSELRDADVDPDFDRSELRVTRLLGGEALFFNKKSELADLAGIAKDETGRLLKYADFLDSIYPERVSSMSEREKRRLPHASIGALAGVEFCDSVVAAIKRSAFPKSASYASSLEEYENLKILSRHLLEIVQSPSIQRLSAQTLFYAEKNFVMPISQKLKECRERAFLTAMSSRVLEYVHQDARQEESKSIRSEDDFLSYLGYIGMGLGSYGVLKKIYDFIIFKRGQRPINKNKTSKLTKAKRNPGKPRRPQSLGTKAKGKELKVRQLGVVQRPFLSCKGDSQSVYAEPKIRVETTNKRLFERALKALNVALHDEQRRGLEIALSQAIDLQAEELLLDSDAEKLRHNLWKAIEKAKNFN